VASRRARPVLGEPTYMAPRYHSRIWGRLIFAFFLVLILIVVGGAGGLYWSIMRPQSAKNTVVTFRVSPGDTTTTIADRLQQQGVINNALLFRIDARLHNLAGKLKVGDYKLRKNMSIDGMVAALQVYHQRTISITIPEGLRAEQIAARLQKYGMSGKSFLREVRHPNFTMPILRDKPRGAGLQGYLYPNTYDVPPGYTGAAFAELMVKTLAQVFTTAMQREAIKSGRGIYGILKLASIVEREARVPSERPIIAGVYANRLRIGMVLDADPTVQYAVGAPHNWWPILVSGQEDAVSAYNTYTHHGLPPTPICNPGLASIDAALHPARTKYLYFVAKGHTGHHVFARTYAEQLANQQKYGEG
jgi:UPF0755 protein